MRNPRICVFFSDTGGGHRSAAEAVEQALLDMLNQVEPDSPSAEIIVDNGVEKSHPLNRYFVQLYNYLLRHNQSLMKYYYWFIEKTKPNDSEYGYQCTKPYLLRLFDEGEVDMIVSVHPMSNHYLARAIKDSGRKIKLITVVTDPNGDFWSGWACPDADLTIVPNELGRDRLLSWGIKPERIMTAGMPVHPDFIKPPSTSKEEFLAHLGLSAEKPTVCINAGWAGGGNMLAIYKALAQNNRHAQVIFLCGHNKELYERVKGEAKDSGIPTAILPFHDRMSDLMSAVDLMVTKAGGLTSFEAIARRLPMAIDMITKPMPQELGTAKLLCEQGVATAIEKPEDIIEVVNNLKVRTPDNQMVLPDAYGLSKVGAVYDIASSVLGLAGVKLKPASKEAFIGRV
jgi:UDP-N-acetylglucosamine:LPS N-acetylglucosamine transferase